MFIWFYRPERSTGPHPSLITVPKRENTLRAFVLGGSAAMGTSKPAYGFTRILELMLQDKFPDQEVEVINAAMRGINSHILVPIARQCAQLQPDLMIVYSGNSEHTGRYGADTLYPLEQTSRADSSAACGQASSRQPVDLSDVRRCRR